MKKRVRALISLIMLTIGIAMVYLAASSGNGASFRTFILLVAGLFLAIIGVSVLLTKPRPEYDLLSDYWGPGPRNERQAAIDRREQGVLVSMTVPMRNEFSQAPPGNGMPAEPLERIK